MGREPPFSRREPPRKKIKQWIDAIPNNCLIGTFVEKKSILNDEFFRLDCQGVTTDAPRRFNLQVQVNFETPDTTMARLAPCTIAWALVPIEGVWTPQEIKEALKSTATGGPIGRPGPDGIVQEEPSKKGKKK